MTTPLIVLGILLAPWAVMQVLARTGSQIDTRVGGVIGLSGAFVFFGVGHFVQTQPMMEMLPSWVPFRLAIVYSTGILEWVLALGVLVPKTRRLAGWGCIAVLVLFFPANIYAAINSVGMGGHTWGPVYLLIRAPLQVVIIGWAYWFAAGEVRHERARREPGLSGP